MPKAPKRKRNGRRYAENVVVRTDGGLRRALFDAARKRGIGVSAIVRLAVIRYLRLDRRRPAAQTPQESGALEPHG